MIVKLGLSTVLLHIKVHTVLLLLTATYKDSSTQLMQHVQRQKVEGSGGRSQALYRSDLDPDHIRSDLLEHEAQQPFLKRIDN